MSLHPYTRILCQSCGHDHYVPVYCGNRFCPICQVGRLSRIRHRLEFLVESAKKAETRGFRHLTLTIVSHDNLSVMVDRLNSSFRRLRSKKFWKSKVSGGAFVIEVTRSPAGWHAHLHIIIQSDFIPWTELRNLWLKISGASGCFIQRIPARAVVAYLTKYLTKPQVAEDDVPAVNRALKGARLFSPFGSWYAVSAAYRKPLCPCSHCGVAGSFTLYALGLGGQIVEMLDSVTLARYDPGARHPIVAVTADAVPF